MSEPYTAERELEYVRDLAAGDALRAIKNLRQSLDTAEAEIMKGKDGSPMRPDWAVPNHQYLQEVTRYGERFCCFWNAAGIAKERS